MGSFFMLKIRMNAYDVDAINEIFENGVNEGFVEIHGDYFVHEPILEYDSFGEELEAQGKTSLYSRAG